VQKVAEFGLVRSKSNGASKFRRRIATPDTEFRLGLSMLGNTWGALRQKFAANAAGLAAKSFQTVKTGLADGQPGNVSEWRLAETTIGRKEGGKQAFSGQPKQGPDACQRGLPIGLTGEVNYGTTEDDPPPNLRASCL